MRKISLLTLILCVMVLTSCSDRFWQSMAQGSMMALGGASPYGYNSYTRYAPAYNPYIGYTPVMPYSSTSSSSATSEPIEKELKIEENGFKWYETKQGEKRGAEDYNHNVLISLSRGYTFIVFHPLEGKTGYFGVQKDGKKGACDAFGEEVIAPLYENALYYKVFRYKDSSGNLKSTHWDLDSDGKRKEIASKSIMFIGGRLYDKGELTTDKTQYNFIYDCYSSYMEFRILDGVGKEVERHKFIPSTSILMVTDKSTFGKSIKIQYRENGDDKLIRLNNLADTIFDFVFVDSFDSNGKAKDIRAYIIDLGANESKYNELKEAVKKYPWNRTIHEEKDTED